MKASRQAFLQVLSQAGIWKTVPRNVKSSQIIASIIKNIIIVKAVFTHIPDPSFPQKFLSPVLSPVLPEK